jgi:hypothetical protein
MDAVCPVSAGLVTIVTVLTELSHPLAVPSAGATLKPSLGSNGDRNSDYA